MSHAYRWCKYSITYTRPDGKTWDKAWSKQVINDPQIDAFKRQCQQIFMQANPGVLLNIPAVRTHFKDGFTNKPENTQTL